MRQEDSAQPLSASASSRTHTSAHACTGVPARVHVNTTPSSTHSHHHYTPHPHFEISSFFEYRLRSGLSLFIRVLFGFIAMHAPVSFLVLHRTGRGNDSERRFPFVCVHDTRTAAASLTRSHSFVPLMRPPTPVDPGCGAVSFQFPQCCPAALKAGTGSSSPNLNSLACCIRSSVQRGRGSYVNVFAGVESTETIC